jgi:hypothetical protein
VVEAARHSTAAGSSASDCCSQYSSMSSRASQQQLHGAGHTFSDADTVLIDALTIISSSDTLNNSGTVQSEQQWYSTA